MLTSGDDALTVDHQLRAAASDAGPRPALRWEDRTWSYAELDRITATVAAGLAGIGVGAGSHVALFMRNCPEWVFAWLGAARSGRPAVAVNAALKGDGLHYILDHSDAVCVVVEEELLDELDAVLDRLPRLRAVVVVGDRRPATPVASFGWNEVSSSEVSGAAPAPDLGPRPGPDDPMMLLYTSGTTGLPKAVRISQRRCVGPSGLLLAAGIGEGDVGFTSLPFFHASGSLVAFWGCFGLRVPLAVGRRFSASRHWEEIRRHRATFFNALGSIIPILMRQQESAADADNSCRVVISAGCPPELWRPFEARFGVEIFEWYGMVEGGITVAGPGAAVGSIGKAAGMQARVVRDDGAETDVLEVGELTFRPFDAPASIDYYKNAEAAEAKTVGGWPHTGDRVYRDAEGWLFYVDRGAHFIRRSGENISSAEVEQVVAAHPAILECAAYGLPSPLGEDDVAVAFVPRPGATVEPWELIAWCKRQMAEFQVPRYLRRVDALPKTETQKVQNLLLRDEGVVPGTFDRQSGSA
jgi:carnitine-CoA ligase